MWSQVVSLFREYMGTGLIVIWYLLSIVYLFLREKRKEIRAIFVYVPIILLLLYFNPLFVRLVYHLVGGETYYRILWLLPMTMSISYACACIYGELKGRKREIFAVCMAGLLMASGSFIYSNPYFHKAENLYHVPDSVVKICDAINVPGREVRAVFPAELLQYVRQYSAVTCMPYGREVLVADWQFADEMFEVMESEEINLELLLSLSRPRECHFIVFRRESCLMGKPAEQGLELVLETGGYAVYRDTAIPLVIPDNLQVSRQNMSAHKQIGQPPAYGLPR